MLKTYFKLFCTCFIVFFISDSISAQTFGSVKKKIGDRDPIEDCVNSNGQLLLEIEILLEELPPNFYQPHVGVTVQGTTTYKKLSQGSLADSSEPGNLIMSVDVDIDDVPCVDGQKMLSVSLDLYSIPSLGQGGGSGSSSDPFIPSSSIGDDVSIEVDVPLCECDDTENDPPSMWGEGRASGKIGDINVRVSQTFDEITVSGGSNEEFKPELYIINLNGQLVKTVQRQETSLISFELADLQKGYYIINGMINNKPYSRSFVKM